MISFSEPEFALSQYLIELAKIEQDIEKDLPTESIDEWQTEFFILSQKIAETTDDTETLQNKALHLVLTHSLKMHPPKYYSWPMVLLNTAFLMELYLSPWGNILLFYANKYDAHPITHSRLTQFPHCLLPTACLICDSDLQITKETFTATRRGYSKVLCERCAHHHQDKKGFKKVEIPDRMKSYQNVKANEWIKMIEIAMKLIQNSSSAGTDKEEVMEKLYTTVFKAYAFFLNQYKPRLYRPRYTVFYDYPHDWFMKILFFIAMGKHVFLRIQDPYISTELNYVCLPEKEVEVEIPPMFTPAIEGLQVTQYDYMWELTFQHFDTFFKIPIVNK